VIMVASNILFIVIIFAEKSVNNIHDGTHPISKERFNEIPLCIKYFEQSIVHMTQIIIHISAT
jgi:hypothetical protein